jgi:serine/threonine-protein kinase
VKILDDDVTEDGLAFLVMELLEGQTWKQAWLDHEKRLPVLDVLRTSLAVLDVLAAAHQAGVIHRDVKPENASSRTRAR